MHCCTSSWPSCAASMAFFMHSPAVLHPPGNMAATPSAAARPPSGMTAGEAGAQQQAQALGQRPQPAQPEERRQQPGLVGVHQALRPGNRPPALTDSSSGTALQPGQPLLCITLSLPVREVQRSAVKGPATVNACTGASLLRMLLAEKQSGRSQTHLSAQAALTSPPSSSPSASTSLVSEQERRGPQQRWALARNSFEAAHRFRTFGRLHRQRMSGQLPPLSNGTPQQHSAGL